MFHYVMTTVKQRNNTYAAPCTQSSYADCIDFYCLLTFSGQTVFKTQTLLANRARKQSKIVVKNNEII